MKSRNNRVLTIFRLLLIGSIMLVGCAAINGEDPTTIDENPVLDEELSEEEIILLAKEDLASRKGVAVDEIGAPSVEEQTWSDASLGCPQDGMDYAQVLTPGYRILLAIGGPASIEQFDYRTDKLGNIILCEG